MANADMPVIMVPKITILLGPIFLMNAMLSNEITTLNAPTMAFKPNRHVMERPVVSKM
jgi:hypothetical protein